MQIAGKSNIGVSEDGDAWLRGFRCTACGATADGLTLACRKCHARGTMEEYRAAQTGKLVTWSIVYRSYPGIAVPFVSAVVQLDDGLTVKGNLTGVEHGDLHQGMPVTLVFDDAGGAKDKDGNGYVAYHFATREKESLQ
jgi:uncharacterized protein